MKIQIQVTIDKGSYQDAQKIAALAQKGIIEKYIGRLISAGPSGGAYITNGTGATTYLEIEDEKIGEQ